VPPLPPLVLLPPVALLPPLAPLPPAPPLPPLEPPVPEPPLPGVPAVGVVPPEEPPLDTVPPLLPSPLPPPLAPLLVPPVTSVSGASEAHPAAQTPAKQAAVAPQARIRTVRAVRIDVATDSKAMRMVSPKDAGRTESPAKP
jgi:hypothetical protein